MDFNNEENVTLDGIMNAMLATGFQATNVALAIHEINRMVYHI
jgi:deoxyhypusine synthase